MSTPNSNQVSILLLERFAANEVTPTERRAVENALAESSDLRAELAHIHASNHADLERYSPPAMARAILERSERTAPGRQAHPWFTPQLLFGLPAVAVAAALAFTVLPGSDESTRSILSPPETTRAKGLAPTLHVHRQTGDTAELLEQNAGTQAGDILQVSYLAAGRHQGVIVSIDGRGSVTLHHPARAEGDTTLLPKGEAALPHAYELDDAPRFERFFLVTQSPHSTETLDTSVVLTAAEKLASSLHDAEVANLELPPGYEQTSLLLKKTEGQRP